MNKYETKIVGSNRVATIDIGIELQGKKILANIKRTV